VYISVKSWVGINLHANFVIIVLFAFGVGHSGLTVDGGASGRHFNYHFPLHYLIFIATDHNSLNSSEMT
jgi:hypothetical protein